VNFNYDLATWINYFIGAFVCTLGLFFSGHIITYKKLKEIKWYTYGLLIVFSFLMIINNYIFNNVTKIFGMILLLFVLFKLIYKNNNNYTIGISIISYIICIISEVSYYIFIVLIENILNISIIMDTEKTIIGNVIIAVLSILYTYLLRKKISSILNKTQHNNIKFIIFLSVLTILVVFSSMYSLYLNNWNLDYGFILNIIIIFGCLILLFVLIKQFFANKEMTTKYAYLKDYLKTSAELIEKYSATTHKYKNNLIIIKGYMKSDMKEANKYIDSLLEQMENKKYSWVKKINYISIDTVRYLIYYKLSKAEAENLKIMVDVSEKVKKIASNILSSKEINILSEIIGEFFDNAIYASSESKKKELNLIVYEENNNIIFTFSNTYKGEIDLSLITNNGFTTKGKGHGFGLYDVEKSIKRNNWLDVKYELLDNYFVTTLTITK